MRRTGNRSLEPAIGNIGWATAKTGLAPGLGALLAQPAIAARPVTAPADNTFLRSMARLLACPDAAPIRRATLAPMLSRNWFFAYFAFSHRPADGEARR